MATARPRSVITSASSLRDASSSLNRSRGLRHGSESHLMTLNPSPLNRTFVRTVQRTLQHGGYVAGQTLNGPSTKAQAPHAVSEIDHFPRLDSTPMALCANCGQDNPEDARFCSSCGN